MRFRAFLLREDDDGLSGQVENLDESELPDADVDVDIEYSSMNYKDGMVLSGLGKLVRSYPHVPGIDFAGVVRASADPRFKTGDPVVMTGWRVGELHWGGFAERARVKGDWLIPLPDGMTLKSSMAVGTAGITAMLAIMALEDAGLRNTGQPVLVTGGAGGVGGVAIALLSEAGYEVHASTGRAELGPYLQTLGARAIIDRAELAQPLARPLGSERWAAAVDAVGSRTLVSVLSQIRYGGAVAACGLAGGNDLPASMIPFLLRGISLLGIDSVMASRDRRLEAWNRVAGLMPVDLLDKITTMVSLDDLPDAGRSILAGRARGRTVVKIIS